MNEHLIVHALLYQSTYFEKSKILRVLCRLWTTSFTKLNGIVLQLMTRYCDLHLQWTASSFKLNDIYSRTQNIYVNC